jgi:hypothetical protein
VNLSNCDMIGQFYCFMESRKLRVQKCQSLSKTTFAVNFLRRQLQFRQKTVSVTSAIEGWQRIAFCDVSLIGFRKAVIGVNKSAPIKLGWR